ncbi:hypothetical protein [Salinarimonas rosea]|uniref:hypothetical protein n=1 Tax=Salinarimonas rosea TaxID=552063 RepID=UPI000492175C|nr:hypothetical protein [Salinarimonas rosea]
MRGGRQTWLPLGRVLEPRPTDGWWTSHAAYPTAVTRQDGTVDIYFSVRDGAQRSSLACVRVALDGTRYERVGPVEGPLLEPGPRGAFDADGVTVGCVLPIGRRLHAYYLGWTVGVSVPFTNFIGLAVADRPGAPFVRVGATPIVGRSEANPLTVGYPWVVEMGVGDYRMWFGSHLSWGEERLAMEHVVKEARSRDGLSWTQSPRVVIGLAGTADPGEFAISRPCVVREPDGTLSMWYARRRPGYALGHAWSPDGGETWERRDDALVIFGAPDAWEATERTYPMVFDHGGERYMLYNGDGYGRTGFGLAVLQR